MGANRPLPVARWQNDKERQFKPNRLMLALDGYYVKPK
jgi:hypothetical protein